MQQGGGQGQKVFAALLVLVTLGFSYLPIADAAPPNPSLGTANIDGNPAEWDLATDFFAEMYRAADPTKKIESKLYLRYDCDTQTLYVLVLAVDGVTVVVDVAPTTPGDAHVKVHDAPSGNAPIVDGNSGDDGTPPDFQWIGLSGDGHSASGWEASAPLSPGNYTKLNVHNNVNDDGQQTSAVANRAIALEISCGALPPPADGPLVSVSKRVSLFEDQNGNGKVNPGDILLYTITISNTGNETATGVTYSDTVDANTSLICSGGNAPTTTQGVISSCTPSPPGGSLTVNVGDIAKDGSATIKYKVEVAKGNFSQVSNQGEATGANFTEKVSDDPDTVDPNDPTVAPVSDPIGFIYDEDTGQILPGGQISVSGPGTVTILHDGSAGFYQWFTDGTPGVYTMTLTPPPNYSLSTTCLPKDPPPFDPTGGPDPTVLGNGEDPAHPGFLTSNACTDYYFTFDLAPGDPEIQNNNFPLKRTASSVVGGDPPIWGDFMAFGTPENALGADLDGDGQLWNTVLRYKNLRTGELANTGIPVSGNHRDIDLYEDTAVFVMKESSFGDFTGTFNLLNSSVTVGPIGTFNLRTGRFQVLDVWGSRPTIYEHIISISGSTLRYYDLTTGRLTDTRIPGEAQALWGRRIAYHHAGSRDTPPMIHVYDLDTGTVINTGVAGSLPATWEDVIAFTTQEKWVAQDLNGDGDLNDSIIRYYDFSSRTVVNTGEVGQDPAIHGRYIVFSSGNHIRYFDTKAGRAFDTGKLGAEPDIYDETITYYVFENLLAEDVNGDGDRLDPIVGTHKISASDRMLPQALAASVAETTSTASSPERPSLARVLHMSYANGIRFLVQGVGVDGIEVEVYDLKGKRIFKSAPARGTALIWNLTAQDGRKLANGVYLYIVKARGAGGQVVQSRIAKLAVLR